MARAERSRDYEIRAGVVQVLLGCGVPRGDIRHEITLDTWSSGGRVDLVVLRRLADDSEALMGIEIKSGSDRLDRLEAQQAAMGRALDFQYAVLDAQHREAMERRSWAALVWWSGGGFIDWYRGEPRAADPSFRTWHRNRRTAPADMARLLWRDEVVPLCGRLGGPCAARTTREAATDWLRENARLCEMRPLVIEALRARVLNRWEEAFWARFDAEAAE